MLPSGTNEEWFQTTSSTTYPPTTAPGYAINMPPLHSMSSPFDSNTNGDASRAQGSLLAGLKNQMQERAFSYVAQEAMNLTKTRASGISRFASVDWLVDWFKPYFFVDVPMVLQRMKMSLMPKSQQFAVHEPDLYGPAMIVFTVALLLRTFIASSSVKLASGSTAIGTSLAVCFGYWFGASALLFVASYASDTRLSLPNMLCMLGYSMTCYLVILPLSYLSGWLFYLGFLTAGGVAAISIAMTIRQATPDVTRGATTATVCAVIHMLYLLYLKWSYLF